MFFLPKTFRIINSTKTVRYTVTGDRWCESSSHIRWAFHTDITVILGIWLRCTHSTDVADGRYQVACLAEMHYIAIHRWIVLDVLLVSVADGSEKKGSSTRISETWPVFPGSRTISVERERCFPIHLWQHASRLPTFLYSLLLRSGFPGVLMR